MSVLCTKNLWADPSAGRQRAVHPTQVGLRYFYPALTDRRQAALLESLAMPMGIEQGEVAMAGVGHEQCLEKAHGCVPIALHA